MTGKHDDAKVELPFGYIMEHCHDWDAFCDGERLNEYLIAEGLATEHDTHEMTISAARNYGLLK